MKKKIVTFNSDKHNLAYKFEYNEEETKKLRDLFSKRKEISMDNLRRVSLWKLNRCMDVPPALLKKLNGVSRKKRIDPEGEEVKQLIEELTNCSGIGFPMASTILKFMRPDVFPIIDARAYRALFGKRLTYSQYSIEKYLDYLREVYRLKKELNLPLDKVDEQLYMFDKENNGKL